MTESYEENPEDITQPPATPSGAVQPGCNEPGVVSPSTVGTTQDPNRKEN